jgi:hypothetical protein
MPPKITDTVSWQQAELLMQPAFIRTIDRIREHLDRSPWKGVYQDVLIWPPETTDETKAIVTQMLQELETAPAEQADEIRQRLARMPVPHPGYHLCLQYRSQQVNIDLWELCYQVCFLNYVPSTEMSFNSVVEVDTSLIDETGDVDWERLDAKAKDLVDRVFASLPEV